MYREKCRNLTYLLEDDFCGRFKVDHFTITEDNIRAVYIDRIPPGEYVRLSSEIDIIMSNTDMEIRTNRKFMENAHGNVLIGGLGLGMIIIAIQDKEDVDKITVIEKNQDIIDLIEPQLKFNDKVEIIKGDVFEYQPTTKYNTIYFDIWNSINSDIYKHEMKPLMDRYRKYLVKKSEDENRFIDCWAKTEARYNRRLV